MIKYENKKVTVTRNSRRENSSYFKLKRMVLTLGKSSKKL